MNPTIIIQREISESGRPGCFHIHVGDKIMQYLAWDEMIAAIMELTHPKLGTPRIPMQTLDQIRDEADARVRRAIRRERDAAQAKWDSAVANAQKGEASPAELNTILDVAFPSAEAIAADIADAYTYGSEKPWPAYTQPGYYASRYHPAATPMHDGTVQVDLSVYAGLTAGQNYDPALVYAYGELLGYTGGPEGVSYAGPEPDEISVDIDPNYRSGSFQPLNILDPSDADDDKMDAMFARTFGDLAPVLEEVAQQLIISGSAMVQFQMGQDGRLTLALVTDTTDSPEERAEPVELIDLSARDLHRILHLLTVSPSMVTELERRGYRSDPKTMTPADLIRVVIEGFGAVAYLNYTNEYLLDVIPQETIPRDWKSMIKPKTGRRTAEEAALEGEGGPLIERRPKRKAKPIPGPSMVMGEDVHPSVKRILRKPAKKKPAPKAKKPAPKRKRR